MDMEQKEKDNFELPAPKWDNEQLAKSLQPEIKSEKASTVKLEKGVSSAMPVSNHVAVSQHDSTATDDQTTSSTSMPAIADDNDLIEKEWVLKAKAIVEHTKFDPHLQNKEMSKVKANYIKKRFDKDIKVVES